MEPSEGDGVVCSPANSLERSGRTGSSQGNHPDDAEEPNTMGTPENVTTTSTHQDDRTDRVPSASAARTPRRGVLAAAVVALLGAPAALVLAAPASAYTTTSSSGVPVPPAIYQVQGSHYNTGSAVTGPMWKPWVYQSGPTVYRVSGSGDQHVRVQYSVDRWTGSTWALNTSQTQSAKIAAATTSAKAPALSVLPPGGSGYYRVRLAMTWTSPLGAVLASRSVAMNSSGDYLCSTTRTCSAGPGYVYVGA